jgi:hypothetical protein
MRLSGLPSLSVRLSVRGLPNKCYVILYGHFVLKCVCNSQLKLNRTTITDTLHEKITMHFVFFPTISHQLDDFQKTFIEHKMCFDFLYKFV